jgi:UDP-N-acetylglucosamine pyrophosphorylase
MVTKRNMAMVNGKMYEVVKCVEPKGSYAVYRDNSLVWISSRPVKDLNEAARMFAAYVRT